MRRRSRGRGRGRKRRWESKYSIALLLDKEMECLSICDVAKAASFSPVLAEGERFTPIYHVPTREPELKDRRRGGFSEQNARIITTNV
jgi:hypothetical protein